MKVIIRQDAKSAYINYMVHSCHSSYCDDYAALMDEIAGMTLEVDTKYLFKTSFNVVHPTDKDRCIDVRWLLCDEVIDDIRHLKMKCGYCGETQDKGTVCINCTRDDCLDDLG